MYVAITISPKQMPLHPKDLLKCYKRHYISKIRVAFILYPEMDLKGRLHFHGVLERTSENINDYNWSIKFLENWCFICVKEISNMSKWNTYCKKEWKLTKKHLDIKKPLTNKDDIPKPMTILDYKDFDVKSWRINV